MELEKKKFFQPANPFFFQGPLITGIFSGLIKCLFTVLSTESPFLEIMSHWSIKGLDFPIFCTYILYSTKFQQPQLICINILQVCPSLTESEKQDPEAVKSEHPVH